MPSCPKHPGPFRQTLMPCHRLRGEAAMDRDVLSLHQIKHCMPMIPHQLFGRLVPLFSSVTDQSSRPWTTSTALSRQTHRRAKLRAPPHPSASTVLASDMPSPDPVHGVTASAMPLFRAVQQPRHCPRRLNINPPPRELLEFPIPSQHRHPPAGTGV